MHFGHFLITLFELKKKIKYESHNRNESFKVIAHETGLRHHEMSLFNIFNAFLKDAFLDKACMLFKLEITQSK